MNVWTQRHDYSSTKDTAIGSAEEAIHLLQTFDWESEIQAEERARVEGRDCCPAGMGLVADDGSILHIIPRRSSKADINFSHTDSAGVTDPGEWNGESVLQVADFPSESLPALIQHHFEVNQAAILSLMETQGTPLN